MLCKALYLIEGINLHEPRLTLNLWNLTQTWYRSKRMWKLGPSHGFIGQMHRYRAIKSSVQNEQSTTLYFNVSCFHAKRTNVHQFMLHAFHFGCNSTYLFNLGLWNVSSCFLIVVLKCKMQSLSWILQKIRWNKIFFLHLQYKVIMIMPMKHNCFLLSSWYLKCDTFEVEIFAPPHASSPLIWSLWSCTKYF